MYTSGTTGAPKGVMHSFGTFAWGVQSGLKRVPVDKAEAGDIVAIAGLSKATVADTLCAMEVTEPLDAQPIDPPTLAMTFRVNDSPLAGTEGKKVTSRVIWDRLLKEAEGNVALKISRSTESESFEVAGRGELQAHPRRAVGLGEFAA